MGYDHVSDSISVGDTELHGVDSSPRKDYVCSVRVCLSCRPAQPKRACRLAFENTGEMVGG